MPLGDVSMPCSCGLKHRRLSNSPLQNSEDALCACTDNGCSPAKYLAVSRPVITTGMFWKVAQGTGRGSGSPSPTKNRKRLHESAEDYMPELAGRTAKTGFSLALRPLTSRGGRDSAQPRKRQHLAADPNSATCLPKGITAGTGAASATTAYCAPRLGPVPASEHFAHLQTVWPMVISTGNIDGPPKRNTERAQEFAPSTSASTTTTTSTTTTSSPTCSTTTSTTCVAEDNPATAVAAVAASGAAAPKALPATAPHPPPIQNRSDATKRQRSTAVAGKPYAVCTMDCTDSTATSPETPPPPPPPLQLHVRTYDDGSKDVCVRGGKMLVVDVEVARVPSDAALKMQIEAPGVARSRRQQPRAQRGAGAGTVPVGAQPTATPSAAAATASAVSAPEVATVPRVSGDVMAVAATTEDDSHRCGPEGQTMRRMLLRLWPLAAQSSGRTPEASQDRMATPGAPRPQPQAQRQPQPQEQPQAQSSAQSPVKPDASCSSSPSRREAAPPGICSTQQQQQLALAGLERLLEAAEAAAAAVAAVSKSLADLQAPTDISLSSSARDAAPLLPRHRVTPEAFFEVDGRLLHGAVLQTACQVMRLAQLGSKLCIQPPWGQLPDTSAVGSTTAGRSGAGAGGSVVMAPFPAGNGRRVVPLSAVLAALVSFTGAARAVQSVQLQWGPAAAEGLRALMPMMRDGYSSAEVLMAEVKRVLTAPPPAQLICGL